MVIRLAHRAIVVPSCTQVADPVVRRAIAWQAGQPTAATSRNAYAYGLKADHIASLHFLPALCMDGAPVRSKWPGSLGSVLYGALEYGSLAADVWVRHAL